jgi:hypothetical protein
MSTVSTDPQDRAIAVHESQHVVCAAALGIPVRRVRMHPPECTLEGGPTLGHVLSLLAPLAGAQTSTGDCADLPQAEACYRQLGLWPPFYAALPTLMAQCRLILVEHQNSVYRVSDALLREGHLAAASLSRLLGMARPASLRSSPGMRRPPVSRGQGLCARCRVNAIFGRRHGVGYCVACW